MPPKFGRGAEESAENKRGSIFRAVSSSSNNNNRPADDIVHVDKLRSLDDGVSLDATNKAAESTLKKKEILVNSVEGPVGYTVTMPKLSDLDISNLWNDFFQEINQNFDMSALTACLSQHLDDEDVPWNPDMLLVQLTSDMLDAAEGNESAALAADRAAVQAASEARWRRKVLLEDADEIRDSAQTRGRRMASTSSNAGEGGKTPGAQQAEIPGKCVSVEAENNKEATNDKRSTSDANGESHKGGKRATFSNWVSVAQKEPSAAENSSPSKTRKKISFSSRSGSARSGCSSKNA